MLVIDEALPDAHVYLGDAKHLRPLGRDVLVGTCPQDWDAVENAGGAWVKALGIHPWQSFDADPSWLEQLEERLQKNVDLQVGEIGLDAVAAPKQGFLPHGELTIKQRCGCKKCTADFQYTLFEAQLRLAAKLQRRVSVHCVRAFGMLSSALCNLDSDNLPPRIFLHSWSGSAETTLMLLKALPSRLYFGVSAGVNARGLFRYSLDPDCENPNAWRVLNQHLSTKILDEKVTWFHPASGCMSATPWEKNEKAWHRFKQRLGAIPRDRLLLESDLPGDNTSPEVRKFSLLLALGLCASALEVTPSDLQCLVARTCIAFNSPLAL